MTGIPDRPVAFTGRPMAKAPRYLIPYLDCVDAAMQTGAITQGRHLITTEWALYRAGAHVGTVTIDMAGMTA